MGPGSGGRFVEVVPRRVLGLLDQCRELIRSRGQSSGEAVPGPCDDGWGDGMIVGVGCADGSCCAVSVIRFPPVAIDHSSRGPRY